MTDKMTTIASLENDIEAMNLTLRLIEKEINALNLALRLTETNKQELVAKLETLKDAEEATYLVTYQPSAIATTVNDTSVIATTVQETEVIAETVQETADEDETIPDGEDEDAMEVEVLSPTDTFQIKKGRFTLHKLVSLGEASMAWDLYGTAESELPEDLILGEIVEASSEDKIEYIYDEAGYIDKYGKEKRKLPKTFKIVRISATDRYVRG